MDIFSVVKVKEEYSQELHCRSEEQDPDSLLIRCETPSADVEVAEPSIADEEIAAASSMHIGHGWHEYFIHL